jgi:Integrase core domain
LGLVYLSTVLDDFSRFIVAWKLCATMRANDVTSTLDMALPAARLNHVAVAQWPRLLSDNGASYISEDLATWLSAKGMKHLHSAPYHPPRPRWPLPVQHASRKHVGSDCIKLPKALAERSESASYQAFARLLAKADGAGATLARETIIAVSSAFLSRPYVRSKRPLTRAGYSQRGLSRVAAT